MLSILYNKLIMFQHFPGNLSEAYWKLVAGALVGVVLAICTPPPNYPPEIPTIMIDDFFGSEE